MQKPTCSLLFDKLPETNGRKALQRQGKSNEMQADARLSLPRTLLHSFGLPKSKDKSNARQRGASSTHSSQDFARTALQRSSTLSAIQQGVKRTKVTSYEHLPPDMLQAGMA